MAVYLLIRNPDNISLFVAVATDVGETISAAEIVSPTLVSTATSDAATIEQTGQPGYTPSPMIKLDGQGP